MRIKTVVLIITALFSIPAESIAQKPIKSVDPTYLAIKKLQPSLTPAEVKLLTNAFRAVSADKACGMPWEILVSIAYHESSLISKKFNPRSKDYGLMQINAKNVLRYGLSQDKLMKDAQYSIRFACRLLKDNKDRYGQKVHYWLGIYRSGTALWKASIQQNAKSYDRIIRTTAQKIGYKEHSELASSR